MKCRRFGHGAPTPSEIEECLEELFKKRSKMKKGSLVLRILNHAVMDTQLNGEEIMYFSGKYIGSKVADVHKKKGEGNIPVIMKKAVEKLDIWDITGIEAKGDKISLEIGACPFQKKGCCKLIQGMLAGIISGTSDRPFKLKSVKPSGRKHICVFQFESVS